MEESKVINNDNNTYIDTSLSTLLETDATNNELNNDNLLKSTGNDGLTTYSSDNYTPILLILGDGTEEPTDEEEPVLLEEDDEIQYEAVINSLYESDDAIPTMSFGSNESILCDLNYVIAITETDKNTPIKYESSGLSLSTSFTDNGNDWCKVDFNTPIEAPFSTKLDVNNFPDYSNIIVPIITCLTNTGDKRNTVITFNIKNFNNLNHTILLKVTLEAVSISNLTPSILAYDITNETTHTYTYKKYQNNEPLYFHYRNNEDYISYLYFKTGYTTGYSLAWFGLLDSNGKADNNLEYTSTDLLEKYNKKFGCSNSGLIIKIAETNAFIKNTALTIVIYTTQTTEVNEDFKITYDGNFLCNVKKTEK